MDRNKTSKQKYINAEQQIPVPYGCMLLIPLTNYHLAVKPKLYPKAYKYPEKNLKKI